MQKMVKLNQFQKATSADIQRIGEFARKSMDDLVKNGLGSGFAGFNIVGTAGQTEITVASGLLFDANGAVHFRDDDGGVEIDLLDDLPAVAQRYAAIVVWGPGAQDTVPEAREFLLDAVNRTTEARLVSTQSWRQASVDRILGAENATPSKPTVSATYTVVGWVLLNNTGIVSVEMNDATRLRSARDAYTLAQLAANRLDALEPRLLTLESDIARVAEATDRKADVGKVGRMAEDIALLKERADLPDDYVDYGADRFLDLVESDTVSAGYAAKVEEGLRFPEAATATGGLVMANPADANFMLKSNILMPAHDLYTVRVISGGGGDMALNSFSYETFDVTQLKMSRVRNRLGDPFLVSEASSWWQTVKWTDSARGVFERDGEEFQAQATYELDAAGHRIYRVQKRWKDTMNAAYWTRTATPDGTTLAGYPWVQNFLVAQDMIVAALSVGFQRLDSDGPVTLGICECKPDGSPDIERVLNLVTVPYASLALGLPTQYAFPPTYLRAGKRYGLMIITAGNHWVQVADAANQNQGTLFWMTAGGYFQADPTRSILFNVHIAGFRQPRSEVTFQALNLGGGAAALDIMLEAITPENTDIDWQVQVGGVWKSFDPGATSPLSTLPATVPLRAVLIGTNTVQPMLMLGDATVVLSRPATAMRHQSTTRELPADADEIVVKARLEHFDDDDHDLTLKLRVDGSDVDADAVSDRVLGNGLVERTALFNLLAPTDEYARVVIGSTSSAASLFVVRDITDVAVS